MPMFFATQVAANTYRNIPGRTTAIVQPGVSGIVRVEGSRGGFVDWNSRRSIITGVALSHSCNIQALHTIGNDVFVYAFGDRIGQAVISGLSMNRDCGCSAQGFNAGKLANSKHGMEQMYMWYKKNRVAASRKPVTMTLGAGTVIEGILINMELSPFKQEELLMKYTMVLQVMPEKF